MIEYGLSVSVNTTPRTPLTPETPRGERTPRTPPSIEMFQDELIIHAPRKPSFASFIRLDDGDTEAEGGGGGGGGRVAATATEEAAYDHDISESDMRRSASIRRHGGDGGDGIGGLRRHLNFAQEDISGSLSPVSFRTNSIKTCPPEESIGDCGVCYSQLPLRANHVFTLCGHLFCVCCLLKWWDTATTCPICRAELFYAEDEEAAADAAADADDMNGIIANDDDDDDDDEGNEIDENGNEVIISNNEGRWMRREFWNHRVDHLIDTDDEDQQANVGVGGGVGGGGDAGVVVASALRPVVSGDNRITRINQYLHQDLHLGWSSYTTSYLDDSTLEQISRQEIQGLRENRDIAMTLFARMRFRETLFEPNRQFMGRVWDGMFVHKNEWTSINPRSYDTVMYEFVIRHDSEISPLFEVNIFGFIKDVVIQQIGGGGAAGGADDDWEEIHEYVFIADVFTPTDFYVNGDWSNRAAANPVRCYGGYNMEEGTLTTQELAIPFSQIRRLYRICGHERWEA